MDRPSNEQIAQMAEAAYRAAVDKAEELGLPFVYGFLGIERAYEAIVDFIRITDLLGVDMVAAIGEAMCKAEAYDMHKEAEEVLRNVD